MSHSVYAFDAYGTIFDVHSAVRRHAAAIGPEADRLSALWRTKQLEYSWVRALCGRYRDFWALTEDALDFALASFPKVDRKHRKALLAAYRELDCYPEAPAVLTRLRDRGAKLAILSNGTPAMLDAAVGAAKLDGLFDTLVSVDSLSTYKTAPAVYDLVETQFRVYPEAVSFQSSNRWDIAGAAAHGFRCVWINRGGAPDEYADLAPVAILPSLDGLEALP